MPKLKINEAKQETTEEQIIAAYEKKWGAGKIHRGDELLSPPRISTNSLELDFAMGGNKQTGIGAPKGRAIRFWGKKSTGKTLNALALVANAQASGDKVCWINAEKTFTAEFAASRGVDTHDLLIQDATIIEEICELIEGLLPTRQVFVIDSATSCISLKAKNSAMTDDRPMIDAKAWTNSLKRINDVFDYNTHTFIFIDQVRVGSTGGFNMSEMPGGGNYIDHLISMEVKFTSGGWLFKKDGILDDSDAARAASKNEVSDQLDPEGRVVKARVEKSKVGRPFRTATLWLDYDGMSYDRMNEYRKYGKYLGIISDGPYYKINGTDLSAHGKPKLNALIDEHPEVQKMIRDAVVASAS